MRAGLRIAGALGITGALGIAGALGIGAALCGCEGAAPASSGSVGTVASAASAAGGSWGAGVTTSGVPERWTEIASDVAPLMMSPTEKDPPPDMIRRGELVRVGASLTERVWEGDLEGVPSKREGMLFRARRTADGSETLAFQVDLGGEVTVGSSAGLCEALGKKGPFELGTCKTSLQRARAADGAIVSFVRCGSGACPVAIERDGKLGAIVLSNLTSTFFVTGKKKSVLVGITRFVEAEGRHSGATIAVVGLDGAEPVKLAEHPADEVDQRDAGRSVQQIVSVAVTRSEIVVSGQRDERGADGKVLSTRKIEARHALPALD